MDSAELYKRVGDYLKAIEQKPTLEICKCLWRFHPDDLEKEEAKRRRVRVDTHPICPLHTREGLVITFIEEWYDYTPDPPNTQESCDICSGYGCPDCRDEDTPIKRGSLPHEHD